MGRLTHLDTQGQAHMVDVGAKAETHRVARAEGRIRMSEAALAAIEAGDSKKAEGIDEPPSLAPGATEGKPGEAGPPAEAPGAKAPGAKGGWFVQAAALSSETAARQLSERLTKAGMTPFVERTQNGASVLYRVRLGPFTSREAAVKVRRHLRAMAVGSNVVRVEQAER